MTKAEFLNELRNRLSGLTKTDIEQRVSFYEEMIDGRMEDGLSEEEAIEQLGSIDDIVGHIMSEIPITKLVKNKVRGKKKTPGWVIALVIILFPLWFSLAVALFSVFLSLWIIVLSFYIVALALGICTLLVLALCVFGFVSGNPPVGFFCIGGFLFMTGITILFFLLSIGFTKLSAVLTRMCKLGIKRLFVGGGEAR